MNNNIITSFQDQLNIHTCEIVRVLAEKFDFSEKEALKFLESTQPIQPTLTKKNTKSAEEINSELILRLNAQAMEIIRLQQQLKPHTDREMNRSPGCFVPYFIYL